MAATFTKHKSEKVLIVTYLQSKWCTLKEIQCIVDAEENYNFQTTH